jgi:hypothetical protein
MIKDLMNNMMIHDLNNMVDLIKILMLWKSSRTSIPVRKGAQAMLQEQQL